MILRKFREEYRNELNHVPVKVPDAERILAAADDAAGKAQERAHLHTRAWMKGAAAAAILFVCSAGTVTAVNIHRSYIHVDEQGYTVSKEEPETEETAVLGADDSTEDYDELPEGIICEEVIEDSQVYDSLTAFREQEDLIFVCPEPEWLLGDAEPEEETVYVSGDTIYYILAENSERYLYVNQWDVRDAQDYGSTTVYDGETANKRTYVTESGFDFVLFDLQNNGEILSTHAVISLNGWELSLDFYGYGEETIEEVLEKLDLELYMQ